VAGSAGAARHVAILGWMRSITRRAAATRPRARGPGAEIPLASEFLRSCDPFRSPVGTRNPGVVGKLRRISEVGFTATLYRDGRSLAGCYVRISNGFGRSRSIGYSSNDSAQDNSYNATKQRQVLVELGA
jgi:hypothetical protein